MSKIVNKRRRSSTRKRLLAMKQGVQIRYLPGHAVMLPRHGLSRFEKKLAEDEARREVDRALVEYGGYGYGYEAPKAFRRTRRTKTRSRR